jgi:hypothetical protein
MDKKTIRKVNSKAKFSKEKKEQRTVLSKIDLKNLFNPEKMNKKGDK